MKMENGANVAKMLPFFSFLLTNKLYMSGIIIMTIFYQIGGLYETENHGIDVGLLVGFFGM